MMAKPDKKMLGTGMARRAADALLGRRAQIDAAVEAAEGGKPAKKAPKKALDKTKKNKRGY